MTAAALKPNLMSHLFATQPEGPDRGTLTASMLSLGLHVAIAAAAVWASVELTPKPVIQPPDVVQPITFEVPEPAAPGVSAPAAASQPSAPSMSYTLPVPDPTITEIPAATGVADPGFVEPGAPASQPAGPPGAPAGSAPAGSGSGEFQIVQVMPALLNTRDVQRALERAYPVFLKEAGIGGRAHLWLFIDENGRVVRAELKQSSGQRALDDVALSVAPMMRFSPAMNRDQRVKVMVHVPLDFKAQ